MNRKTQQIKVRGWHISQERMFNAEEMGQDQLTLSTDGRGFVKVSGSDTEKSVFYGDAFIPLLYTGLLDKNNVEIYEGDIVKSRICFGPGGDHERIFAVKIEPGLGTNIEMWVYNTSLFPEVIGNIYENPELLEKNYD